MLLLIMFATEAKNTTCRENVDVTVVHSGIQNNSEVRSQSISADITGHTLTISFNATDDVYNRELGTFSLRIDCGA